MPNLKVKLQVTVGDGGLRGSSCVLEVGKDFFTKSLKVQMQKWSIDRLLY